MPSSTFGPIARLRFLPVVVAAFSVVHSFADQPFPSPLHGRWTNSLGMVFVHVPETSVAFSIWEARAKDTRRYDLELDRYREENEAATGVTWEDARGFCLRLTRNERILGLISQEQEYRLPNASEWRKALARTNSTSDEGSLFPWGNQWPPPDGTANLADLSIKKALQKELGSSYAYSDDDFVPNYRDGQAGTVVVGSYRPNSLGIYDMAGNVSEWGAEAFTSTCSKCSKPHRGLYGSAFTDGARESCLTTWVTNVCATDKLYVAGFRPVLAERQADAGNPFLTITPSNFLVHVVAEVSRQGRSNPKFEKWVQRDLAKALAALGEFGRIEAIGREESLNSRKSLFRAAAFNAESKGFYSSGALCNSMALAALRDDEGFASDSAWDDLESCLLKLVHVPTNVVSRLEDLAAFCQDSRSKCKLARILARCGKLERARQLCSEARDKASRVLAEEDLLSAASAFAAIGDMPEVVATASLARLDGDNAEEWLELAALAKDLRLARRCFALLNDPREQHDCVSRMIDCLFASNRREEAMALAQRSAEEILRMEKDPPTESVEDTYSLVWCAKLGAVRTRGTRQLTRIAQSLARGGEMSMAKQVWRDALKFASAKTHFRTSEFEVIVARSLASEGFADDAMGVIRSVAKELQGEAICDVAAYLMSAGNKAKAREVLRAGPAEGRYSFGTNSFLRVLVRSGDLVRAYDELAGCRSYLQQEESGGMMEELLQLGREKDAVDFALQMFTPGCLERLAYVLVREKDAQGNYRMKEQFDESTRRRVVDTWAALKNLEWCPAPPGFRGEGSEF